MKIINLFLLFTLCANVFAQNILIGYVTEQNSGKKPVPNAIVNSSGANQNVSTNKGEFILTFQGLGVGENVVLRPEKLGWELVNEKEMKTLIPVKPNENPVKIVLCKAGTLAIAKQAYYKVADPFIIHQYNKKLASLDKEKATYQAEKAKLQEERNRLQNQLEEYAEEFIRVNLDDASEIERRAITLFKEGKIDESIKLRESLKSGVEIKNAVQRKAKEDSIIALHTRNLKALAKDYIFKFDFKAAEQKFEELVLADTTNLKNTFEFAFFLDKQNQYDKAILYYKKALRLAQTEPDLAATQNNLGILYQAKNDYVQALSAYSKALEIRERLAQTNPATYEPDVAATKNNLGALYRAKNDYVAALSAFSKALEIRERLTQTNPATYEPDLAMTQNNLGSLYTDKNDYVSALSAYSKALEIYERLAQTNPAIYEPDVAMTQNNLGILYKAKNEYPAALIAYSKALKIRERLAKTNPATYEPDVAMTQNNLGTLYKAKNDYVAALNAYSKALEIYEQLAQTNPATYEHLVAMTQNNLGNLYQVKNDFVSALSAYSKALEIRERLAQTNPATYEPDVAATKNNLGALYRAKNDYVSALSAYSKALEIRERLAQTNPATYEPDVAMTQNNLGILYQAKNDFVSALSAYSKALEIYERLAQSNPDAHEIEMLKTIVLLGLLQKSDYQAAQQIQIDSYLEKAKKILPKYKDVPLAKTLLNSVVDLEEYFKNVEILSPIQSLQSQVEKESNYAGKIKLQKDIIGKYLVFIQNGNIKFANDLGSSLSNLAWYQLFAKQFKEAEQSAKEALNPTTFKKTEDYDTKIEWTNTNLVLALLFQGKYTEAAKIYVALKDKPYNKATYRETFLADLDELEKAGITHPDVVKIRELLKK